MKLSAALRVAKKYLAASYKDCVTDVKWTYICNAIREACDRNEISARDKARLYKHINKLLGTHSCLEDWLEEHRPGLIQTGDDYTDTVDQVQKIRHQWINYMIAEFEAKEKNT